MKKLAVDLTETAFHRPTPLLYSKHQTHEQTKIKQGKYFSKIMQGATLVSKFDLSTQNKLYPCRFFLKYRKPFNLVLFYFIAFDMQLTLAECCVLRELDYNQLKNLPSGIFCNNLLLSVL